MSDRTTMDRVRETEAKAKARVYENLRDFEARVGEPLVGMDGSNVLVHLLANVTMNAKWTYRTPMPVQVRLERAEVTTVAEYILENGAVRRKILATPDGRLWFDGDALAPSTPGGLPVDRLGEMLHLYPQGAGMPFASSHFLGTPIPAMKPSFLPRKPDAPPLQGTPDVEGTIGEIEEWARQNLNIDKEGRVRIPLPPEYVPKWALSVGPTGKVKLDIKDILSEYSNGVMATFPLHESKLAVEVALAVAGRLETTADVRAACTTYHGWQDRWSAVARNCSSNARELLSKGAAVKRSLGPSATAALERLRDAQAAGRKGYTESLPGAWTHLIQEIESLEDDGSQAFRRLRLHEIVVGETLKAYSSPATPRVEPFPLSMMDRILRQAPSSTKAGDEYLGAVATATTALGDYRKAPTDETQAALVRSLEILAEAVPYDFEDGQEAHRWGAMVRPRLRRLVELAHGAAPDPGSRFGP